MSIAQCGFCGATLGPWEEDSCLSCRAQPTRWFSNTLSALWVLERAPGPLSVYDVEREIRRDLRKTVNRSSLNVSLSEDLRFCWAGKGIYGLFRHGLIPGVRSLVSAAKTMLYSWDGSLEIDELAFVMREIGYRFQQQSLINALNYDDDLECPTWTTATFERTPASQRRLVRLHVAPDGAGVDEMADIYRDRIRDTLTVRERRLASDV
jgi:hypothetical protein